VSAETCQNESGEQPLQCMARKKERMRVWHMPIQERKQRRRQVIVRAGIYRVGNRSDGLGVRGECGAVAVRVSAAETARGGMAVADVVMARRTVVPAGRTGRCGDDVTGASVQSARCMRRTRYMTYVRTNGMAGRGEGGIVVWRNPAGRTVSRQQPRLFYESAIRMATRCEWTVEERAEEQESAAASHENVAALLSR